MGLAAAFGAEWHAWPNVSIVAQYGLEWTRNTLDFETKQTAVGAKRLNGQDVVTFHETQDETVWEFGSPDARLGVTFYF